MVSCVEVLMGPGRNEELAEPTIACLVSKYIYNYSAHVASIS